MFEGSHVVILYVAMATVKYDGLFFSRLEQTMQTVEGFGDVSKIKNININIKTRQYPGKIYRQQARVNLLSKYS